MPLHMSGEGFQSNPDITALRCQLSDNTMNPTTSTAVHVIDDATLECRADNRTNWGLITNSSFGVTHRLSLVAEDGASVGSWLTQSDDLLYSWYNASAVVLTHAVPLALPSTADHATIVVHGAGFLALGADQLVCDLDGTLISARWLDSTRIACTGVNASALNTSTPHSVRVSLSGGVNMSYSPTTLMLHVYEPPTVLSVLPLESPSIGGEVLTVRGSGFDARVAVESNSEQTNPHVRCRVGGVLSPQTTFVNSTVLGCVSPYGVENAEGSVVEVTLNGVHFVSPHSSDSLPRHYFKGLRPPQLTRVHFSAAGERLLVHFDSQPTDRGGQVAIFGCDVLLDPVTTAALRGANPAPASCYWESDSLLAVQLSTYSTIVPGDAVRLRGGLIKPRSRLINSCDALADQGIADVCAANVSLSISVDNPCDDPRTLAIESCAVPTASIIAAPNISKCPIRDPGKAYILDGSFSSGGGTRSLSFEWSLDPLQTIGKTAELMNMLANSDTAHRSVLALTTELDGGERFVFRLRVRSFLCQRADCLSAEVRHEVRRSEGAAPVVWIDSPPQVELGVQALTLMARAQVARCDAAVAEAVVGFTWSAIAHDAAGSSPLRLPPVDAGRPAYVLQQRQLGLQVGVEYKFVVRGCSGTACTESMPVSVRRRVSPLRAMIAGGDRTIGYNAMLKLDAGGSSDPDEPEAKLSFAWSCDNNSTGVAEAPGCPRCERCEGALYTQPSGALPPGVYVFTVNVTTNASAERPAKSASASVRIVVENVPLPTVSVSAPSTPTSSANAKLAIVGNASAQTGLTFQWRVEPPVVNESNSAVVTTTGLDQPNLVVLPGILSPGAWYTFTFSASVDGEAWASASAVVEMNRPPFGGALEIACARDGVRCPSTTPFRALLDLFTLTAYDWTDDPSDLPLRYGFALSDFNGTRKVLSAPSLSRRLGDVRLPAGRLTLIAMVVDQSSAIAEASTVEPLVIEDVVLDTAAQGALINDMEGKLQSGDAQAATQAIAAISAKLNAANPATPARSAIDPPAGPIGRRLIDQHLYTLANTTVASLNASLGSLLNTTIASPTASLGSASPALSARVALRASLVSFVARATATSAVSPMGILQSSEALASITADAAELSAVSVGAGASAITTLVDGMNTISTELREPLEPRTEQSVLQSASALLETAVASSAGAAISSLPSDALVIMDGLERMAGPLVSGRLSGEPPLEISSSFVHMRMAIVPAAQLVSFWAGQDPTNGEVVSVTMPSEALQASHGGHPLDDAFCSVTVFHPDTHRALNTSSTVPITEVLLGSPNGNIRHVSNLTQPVRISLPISPPHRPMGNCANDTDCNRGGLCHAGECWCDAYHLGHRCSEVRRCQFWNASESTWSSDGVSTTPPRRLPSHPPYAHYPSAAGPPHFPDAELECNTTHLSRFSGVAFPSSADDFFGDVGSMFAAPDAAAFANAFDLATHPFAAISLFLAVCNVLSVVGVYFLSERIRKHAAVQVC